MAPRPGPKLLLLSSTCAAVLASAVAAAAHFSPAPVGRRSHSRPFLDAAVAQRRGGNDEYIATIRHASDDGEEEGGEGLRRSRRVEAFVKLLLIRGGGDDFDDQYDEYEEEEEEEVSERMSRSRPPRPSPPPPSRRQDLRDGGGQSQRQRQRQRGGRGAPPPSHPYRRRPPPPPPRKKGGAVDAAAGFAKGVLDGSTGMAVAGLKGTGKAAFYLASPKHVGRREVCGIWRFDQQVGKMPDGPFQSCAANVEFTPKGDAIAKYNDETYRTAYRFTERSWPRSCTIDFDARAFQGPDDDEPVLMHYTGYFRRKMADRSVVKIVGRIYEIRRGFWGGKQGKRVQVGTFTARRRMAPPPPPSHRRGTGRASFSGKEENFEDDYDDFYDDEYDDYDSDAEGGYEDDYYDAE